MSTSTCQACKGEQPTTGGVQCCEACGEVGTLTVPAPLPEPIVDTFTRERLSEEALQGMVSRIVLVSTIWSDWQGLQPLHVTSVISNRKTPGFTVHGRTINDLLTFYRSNEARFYSAGG